LGAGARNKTILAEANLSKVQGARKQIDAVKRIICDEQRRILIKFARPSGSQKIADFCVATSSAYHQTDKPPRCVLKSSNFLSF